MRSFATTALVVLWTVSAFATISVSAPANGSTVSSPTHFVAYSSSANPITGMHIYVDGNDVYGTGGADIDTYIPMAAGWHSIWVKAWDSSGLIQQYGLAVTVNGTAAAVPIGPGVSIGSPANGATVSSPVNVAASARSSSAITGMHVYVDGRDSYATGGASVNTALPMSTGQHYVVVQAWDAAGAIYKASANINVTGAAASNTGATTSPGATIYNIDEMSGWEHCSTCAGEGGSGPTAQYGMSQGISVPSLDGRSAQFSLGGSTPYSNALWWKQLGSKNATHFVYDLNFYLKNPELAQALEFDVNQSVGGYKYIFGVECSPRGSGQWDVWDGAARTWRPTGVACPMPSAYQWHHLTEEFVRGNNGQVTFVAITLDGAKHYINRTYWSVGSGVSELNVAFQMDGDYAQHPFSTFLDGVKLTYW